MACSNPCRRCCGRTGRRSQQTTSNLTAQSDGQGVQCIPVKRHPHPICVTQPEEVSCRQIMELLCRQEYLLEEIRALLLEKVTTCEQTENKC